MEVGTPHLLLPRNTQEGGGGRGGGVEGKQHTYLYQLVRAHDPAIWWVRYPVLGQGATPGLLADIETRIFFLLVITPSQLVVHYVDQICKVKENKPVTAHHQTGTPSCRD